MLPCCNHWECLQKIVLCLTKGMMCVCRVSLLYPSTWKFQEGGGLLLSFKIPLWGEKYFIKSPIISRVLAIDGLLGVFCGGWGWRAGVCFLVRVIYCLIVYLRSSFLWIFSLLFCDVSHWFVVLWNGSVKALSKCNVSPLLPVVLTLLNL